MNRITAAMALIIALALTACGAQTETPASTPPSDSASSRTTDASTPAQPTNAGDPSREVPTGSSTPGETSAPAAGDKPDFSLEYLNGEETPEANAMALAAHAYLSARFTEDYSTPYPGFDIQRMIQLSTGDLKQAHEETAKGFEHGPRRSEAEEYQRMNDSSPGGVYKQTMSVYQGWVDESSRAVVLDINTDNTLDHNELVEDTWHLTMRECDTSEFGWCVSEEDNTPEDG